MQGPAMNKPERIAPRESAPLIVHSGNLKEFRKIAARVRANIPKSKKGASVVRELHKLRDRERY
jgi:hypothetical protein